MNILIVDDETNVLNELPKAFTRFYPEAIIHIAWSYNKAIELLNTTTYDIIMLDGQLEITKPWEHTFGYNLIKPIRESKSSHAKIIMISTDEQMRNEGVKLGANFAISKNFFFRRGKVVNSLNKDFKTEEGLL